MQWVGLLARTEERSNIKEWKASEEETLSTGQIDDVKSLYDGDESSLF